MKYKQIVTVLHYTSVQLSKSEGLADIRDFIFYIISDRMHISTRRSL